MSGQPWLPTTAFPSFLSPEALQWAGLNDGCHPLYVLTRAKSCRAVGATVGKRLGKTILELGMFAPPLMFLMPDFTEGGNNACVVMDDADLGMALRSCVFGAVRIHDHFLRGVLQFEIPTEICLSVFFVHIINSVSHQFKRFHASLAGWNRRTTMHHLAAPVRA